MVPAERLGTSHQPAIWRSGTGLLIALCLLSLLAACGQTDAGPCRGLSSPIPGVPREERGTGRPDVNFGPYAHKAPVTPPVRYLGGAQLNGDEWNLGGGGRHGWILGMSVDHPGVLAVWETSPARHPARNHLPGAERQHLGAGLPKMFCTASNQCHTATSPPESRSLPLPMQVRAIPSDLIGTTAYSSRTHAGDL